MMERGYITDNEYLARQRADLKQWQDQVRKMMSERRCCPYALAKGTGLSRTNILRILNGENYPKLSTMSKIHLFLENYEK